MKPLPLILLLTLCAILPVSAEPSISEKEVIDQVFSQARQYFADFQHPETSVLYNARLSGKDSWTSPSDVLAEKPKPWGYGSRIADTSLHTGHILTALLDAYAARPDPFLKSEIRKCFEALKLIGSLPETQPKAGKPALSGLVPRGPHPNDLSAWYDDSSMDQHTTYIISLALFANSPFATNDDKKWIKQSLGKVGRRLEGNDWSIKRADGVTESHVGFSWKGHNSDHASILLPAVLALYYGTGDAHWLEQYEYFISEADGKRWKAVHPGPHIKINGHPIYANQNAFRVNAWYHIEKNVEHKKIIAALLKQSTEMQLARDFPGEMYRKFHPPEQWERISKNFNWGGDELQGTASAWDKFDPKLLEGKDGGMAALAHVRFPLGGFHMVLQSENPQLMREHIPAVWKMLSTVDLEKIASGETHYLFTVVGLHLYALYFRQPELFESAAAGDSGKVDIEYPIATDAGTGPVMAVATVGDHAYSIGKGALQVLDISVPKKPRILSKLSGLGSVRQIEVRDSIAYITSRQDGLFIVDVKNPAKPKLLNHYDTVEFATGIAISGDVLFVALRNYGVELVDVTDPAKPSHISLVRTGEAQSVVARNGYLYVGVWATSELVVVDVRNPWLPKITAKVPLDGYGDGVDVAGGYVYVATGHHSRETPRKNPGDPGFGKGHGLEVFKIDDPAKPTFVSRIKFPPLYEIGNDMWEVTIANGHAFVADTWNGMFIVDISDPKKLQIVGHCKAPKAGAKTNFIGGLSVINDHIFLAGGYSDLHVVPVPGLAKAPQQEADKAPSIGDGKAATKATRDGWRVYQPGGQVYGVAFLSDDEAAIACGSAGVHIVKLWPKFEQLAVLPTEGFAMDVSVSNNRIFVAESAGGLSIWQAGSDENFNSVGRFELRGAAIRQVETPDSSNRILIQAGANQFYILDVSDPTKPKQLLKDSRHGLLYGDQMMRGLVEDRYTAVHWHVSGTHWYDLKAEPLPDFSGDNFAQRIGSKNGLIAVGDKTLATLRGGYVLLDRSERRPIKELDVHSIGIGRSNPGVPNISGKLLYTSDRSTGLVTITDISDLLNPKPIKQFETPGNPTRIEISKGRAVIPDGYHGLMVQDR